jgi:hypothetical protein
LQSQSNWWSYFAKRFRKRLQLHQGSHSTSWAGAGAGAGVFFWGVGALPNRPCICLKILITIYFLCW